MAMDGDGLCFFILWLLIAFMIGVTVGVEFISDDQEVEEWLWTETVFASLFYGF